MAVMDSLGAIFNRFEGTWGVRSEPFRIAYTLKSLSITALMTAERRAEYGDISRFDVNVQVALARLNDNIELYHKLLGIFSEQQAPIRQALQHNDYPTVRHLAHHLKVKGAAASIGAEQVHEAAQKVEQAVVDLAFPDIETLLRHLETTMQTVLPVIERLRTEHNSQPSQTTVSQSIPATLVAPLIALSDLLAQSDTESVNRIDELLTQPLTPAQHVELTRAQKFIHRYDFDSALKIVQALLHSSEQNE